MSEPFPSRRLRVALLAYRALWWLGLPLVLAYLAWRGRRDRDYAARLRERFGVYPAFAGAAPVWIHAVSLGEMRSATPIVTALLDEGIPVVLTHFTPAGRREAARALAGPIAAGRVLPVWVPFELGFAWRRFLRHFAPRCGLVMEIEIWPVMIMECRRAGLPLFMCNAQYPARSFARDSERTKLRAELMRGFSGALVKSDLQRRRFAQVGVQAITVTGETRFDQPIPAAMVEAGRVARAALGEGRGCIAFASVVAGEDAVYLDAIEALFAARDAAGERRPLVVYIPRAPERFDEVAALIAARGLACARRSAVFDPDLRLRGAPPIDILLGDSLGEMYFYLAMADSVVVGGGFTAKGAHNVIEPLALGRAVIVGPETWTIEYPAAEAIAAGVCLQARSPEELAALLVADAAGQIPRAAMEGFVAAHSGAAARTVAFIRALEAGRGRA